MKNSEHIAGYVAKMPSKKERERVKRAPAEFKKAYRRWLKEPPGNFPPQPEEYCLTASQVVRAIKECLREVNPSLN